MLPPTPCNHGFDADSCGPPDWILQTISSRPEQQPCIASTTPRHFRQRAPPLRSTVGSVILLVGGDDLVRAHVNEAEYKGFSTRQVTMEDYESFVQLRVKLNLVIASKEYFIAPAFVIHDAMIRINRAWLEGNTEEVIWMSSDESVGLRMRALEKQATEDEAKSFDLEIQGMCFHLLQRPIRVNSIRAACSFGIVAP